MLCNIKTKLPFFVKRTKKDREDGQQQKKKIWKIMSKPTIKIQINSLVGMAVPNTSHLKVYLGCEQVVYCMTIHL